MLLYHNLSHIFNMAEEILIPPANHRGKALDWTFLEAFPTMELLMASCHESGFKKGRINDTAMSTKRYFNCKISGCPKRLRSVTLLCERAEEEEEAPAWMRQPFNLNSPIAHPEQNEAALAGLVLPDMPAFDDIMTKSYFGVYELNTTFTF